MRGNHVLKVTAHANAPINAHPNFRQYEFFIDGLSFFSMPKVYRLGLNDNIQVQDHGTLALAHSSRVGGYSNYAVGADRAATAPTAVKDSIVEMETPTNADEEEAFLKEAIKASLEAEKEKEGPQQFGSGGSYTQGQDNIEQGQPDLLIDFMSEPGPVPAPAPSNLNANMNQSQELAVNSMNATPFSAYAIQRPAPANAYPGVSSSVASANPFAAPVAVPTPIVATSASSITSSFTGNNSFAAPAPTIPFVPTTQPPLIPPSVPEQAPTFPVVPVAPAPPPPAPPSETATPTTPLTMAPKNTGLGSDANDAFAKFASMDQFDLVKPNIQAKNPFDTPVPTTSIQPPNGTLAGMKANNNMEKKEIMKPSGNTNALVMSSAPQGGNWGGLNYGNQTMGMQNQGMGMQNQGMGMQGQQGMQGYGYPQQQQYGAPNAFPQYGQQMGMQQGQQMGMQDPNQQQQGMQQPYGQNFQQGYGSQPQQF